jgi:exodeoxyribonuclease-3
MKLIQWNCQGSFRTKNQRILSLKPDILLVAECECSEKLKFGKLTPEPNDHYWYGENTNKGICLFSYSDYKIELLDSHNSRFKYILPYKVSNTKEAFILFAIWAMNDKENWVARYIGQVWLAINYYTELFREPTILFGDFNSNKIWDYKERVGNHSDVVRFLEDFNIKSLYHEKTGVEHGKEVDPTFFMFRKENKPYHIDYCFASEYFRKQEYEFHVGKYNEWCDLSDHAPIIVRFDDIK